MRYVADDGTEFDTEKECLEYEKDYDDIRLNSFVLYDKKGNKLPLDQDDSFDMFEYILILKRAKDVSCYLDYSYGMINFNDITKEGLYWYDDEGRFRYVDDLIKFHKDKIHSLIKIRNMIKGDNK